MTPRFCGNRSPIDLDPEAPQKMHRARPRHRQRRR
jgi:hypothetical protein